jgi:ribosomal protein L11 methyltransferase
LADAPALDLVWPPAPDDSLLRELLHASLDDYEPQAIHDREGADGWRVFFKSAAQRDRAAEALAAAFAAQLTRIERLSVPDDDWSRRNQAGLTAVRIGRIVVAPPWDVPAPAGGPDAATSAGDLLVVIDPSTGFGTGHHESTRLCLGLLQELDLSGRRVIDVGTGSGVLAIAASKLGAASVAAVDNDPDALANARDNLALNGCADALAVYEADLSSLSLDPADLVTANLTPGALEMHAIRLRALLRPGGTLLISGFGPEDASLGETAFGALTISRRVQEGNWIAMALTARC